MSPFDVKLLYSSPLPLGTRSAAQRINARNFLLSLLLVAAALKLGGVSLVAGSSSSRALARRVLRAPYKNKNAWTPYVRVRHNYTVQLRAHLAPRPASEALARAHALGAMLSTLDLAHVNLTMVKVRSPGILGPM